MSSDDLRRRLGLKPKEPGPVQQAPPSRADDGAKQKRMQRAADQRVLDVARTFNEIQTGPNPLTADEVKKLSEKRPQYAILVPPEPDEPKDRRVMTIPLPARTQRVRVPPLGVARKNPIRQTTVIDHKDDGTPYIRAYVERDKLDPHDPYYQASRLTTTIHCHRKLGFSISITACHHYCEAPCEDHLLALHDFGWSRRAPTSARWGKYSTQKEWRDSKREEDEE